MDEVEDQVEEFLASISAEEKLDLIELLEAKVNEYDRTKLYRYAPYPKQMKFHAAGRNPTVCERLLIAANQCVSPWTFLETPEGARLAGDIWSGPVGRVLALVDGLVESVPWQRGMLRSIEPAFRVVLDTGRFFDCTRKHQVLTTGGWLSFGQIMLLSSGLRCSETPEDFLASCVEDGHLDGLQLQLVAGIDQGQVPSPGGVQTRSPLSLTPQDAEVRTPEHIRACLAHGPLAISGGAVLQLADLFAQFSGPKLRQSVLHKTESSQVFRRFAAGLSLQFQASSAVDPGLAFFDFLQQLGAPGVGGTLGRRSWKDRAERQFLSVTNQGWQVEEALRDDGRIETFYPFSTPQLAVGGRIVAVVPLGYQPILDCQVPNHHNYLAGGVAHHNCGKTLAAAHEVAYHLTGDYPDWWPGAEWDYAVTGWAASETSQGTRDSVQRLLLGPPGAWGTGTIPGDRIVDIRRAASAVPDCVDTVTVRHASGGLSRLVFKTYDQGRARWQAESLDFVWFDEEPDEDIYFEGTTRTNATRGISFLTFTPLKGMSKVVKRFLKEKAPGTFVVHMTLDDAGHYTPEQRAAITAKYPAHEREARARGIPAMGSGLIYPVTEESITIKPFRVPDHWARICGIDFGWDHPTAVVWLAWDRDTDVVYVTDVHKAKEQTPVFHAAAIKARGDWIPVAWPHDGLQHDKGGGAPLSDQYRKQGCKMLPEKATHPPEPGEDEGTGGNTVEAGVLALLDRMQTGRLKVFSHLSDWFEEVRMYHREDGKIVKDDDDVLDATRYAHMMLRFAKTRPVKRRVVGGVFVPTTPGMGY